MINMKIEKYKLIDNAVVIVVLCFIIVAVVAYPIAYWPHYEKKTYEKQEVLTKDRMEEIHQQNLAMYGERWKTDFTGYPVEGIHTELSSYEQFENDENKEFCLEVDAKQLEPTGVYQLVYEFETKAIGGGGVGLRRSSSSSMPSSAEQYVTSYFKTVLNRNKGIYAQYYALTLEDGKKILVLLNDTVIELPKNGIVQLPYAEKEWIQIEEINNYRELWVKKYALDYDKDGGWIEVLNASSGWFLANNEIEDIHQNRDDLCIFLFIGGLVGALVVFFGSVAVLMRVK